MGKQELDSASYETVAMNVGKIASSVANVKNGLNTDDGNLKVHHIQQIFNLYNELTTLVSTYGQMVTHDLKEFEQIGVNIQKTDEDAK